MKAVELEEKSFLPEYRWAIVRMKTEAQKQRFEVGFFHLSSETITALLSEGFDVDKIIKEGKTFGYIVSSRNATHGRKGVLGEKLYSEIQEVQKNVEVPRSGCSVDDDDVDAYFS